ncbi:cytochrome b/b6 domain-containing protein [Agromyces bauzanensis]
MVTSGRTLRRGLPRERGGDAWPPQGDAPVDVARVRVEAAVAAPVVEQVLPRVEEDAQRPPRDAAGAPPRPAVGGARRLRGGLPRVPGGRPWPESGEVPTVAATTVTDAAAAPTTEHPPAPAQATTTPPPPAAPAAVVSAAPSAVSGGRTLRRGLPRVAGGDPWPPSTAVAPAAPAPAAPAEPATAAAPTPSEQPAAAVSVAEAPAQPTARRGLPRPEAAAPQPTPEVAPAAAPAPTAAPVAAMTTAPTPPAKPATPRAAAPAPAPKPAAAASEAKRYGRFTLKQWIGASVIGILAIIGAATIVVQLTRWFIGLDFMQDFLAAYPGETHLPEGAPVGLPAWLGWQHFFNVFLMVLIIRSGLQVRLERRPAAYWTPRWSKGGAGKISLNAWFHQSLDILWLVNGVIFVVLLFATGQWVRVVPTSWEVIPNAISAGLQYASLDWPLENGWVNYNSLQVLAYFATIFIAAPLAVLTGVRMSGLWPKNAATLNRIYPVEWARAVHFPVMLYFVGFIVVHVTLVLTTGALRNLNHIYTARDANDWVGFWLFVGSLVLIAAAWVAARPMVLAPIAGLFGRVGR